MTDLCVPIFVQSSQQAKRDIAAAAEAGADLVELRIDTLTEITDDVAAIALDSVLPCIITCRPAWEGGESTLPDDDRAKLLNQMTIGKTRYVDIELETFRRYSALQSPLIVSSHD